MKTKLPLCPTKGREHRQEPHASRLQIAVCTWHNAYTVHWSTTLYLHLFNFPHYQYLLISNDGNISFVLTHHSQKTSLLFCHITRKNLEYFLKIFLEYVWLTNIRVIYFYLAVVFKSELLKKTIIDGEINKKMKRRS